MIGSFTAVWPVTSNHIHAVSKRPNNSYETQRLNVKFKSSFSTALLKMIKGDKYYVESENAHLFFFLYI